MEKKLSVLVVFFGLIVIFCAALLFQSQFINIENLVNLYIIESGTAGVLIFILFAAFSTVISMFSSLPAVPFAVLAWGKTLTFVFLITGWVIGSLVSYVLGRYGLYTIFKRSVFLKKVVAYQQKLSENSEFILVVLFRLALPSEITGLVLGGLRYNFTKYLLATFISEIPFAIVAVYASGALIFSDIKGLLLWVAFGGVGFFIVAKIFTKRIKLDWEK